MRFKGYWLYDLRSLSSFWKRKIQSSPQVIYGNNPWQTLLPIYGIQTFSSLHPVEVFAQDYFERFHSEVSLAQQKKIFSQLDRLGIKKLGQLRKIPSSQMQKRWGKNWAHFFKGVLQREEAVWPWIPERKPLWIEKEIDFDFGVVDAVLLENSLLKSLEKILKEKPSLYLKRISIELCSQEPGEDQSFDLHFHSHPLLSQSLDWIRRLLLLRFSSLQLFAPISKVKLQIEPSPPARGVQLSLFQSKAPSLSADELSERLKTLGAKIFQPEACPSQLPEKSWRMIQVSEKPLSSFSAIQNRPLIQYAPKIMPPPDFQLFPVEKIDDFMESGERIHRDYYVGFFKKKWRWIFMDQNSCWYEQGIAE
jgi:hypothetical protein